MFKGSIIIIALCFAFSFAEIEVNILVINEVDSGRTKPPPPYDVDFNVTGLDKGVTLEYAMNKSRDDKWTFKGTRGKYGLYVTTIDGVYADPEKKEYWHILENPGGNSVWKPIPVGVSSYKLNVTGQKILFRRDTWSDESGDEAHGDDCGEHSYDCKSGSVSVDHGYWFLISTLLATFTHWI